MRKSLVLTSLILTLLLLGAGCRIPPDVSNRETQIKLSFAPDPPSLGDTMLVVTVLHDRVGQQNVQVMLRGVVNTVGIPPETGGGITDAEGHTVIPFQWTYGGDWIITVTAALPNGRTKTQDFRIYVPDAPA
jgi:hypothetical protein